MFTYSTYKHFISSFGRLTTSGVRERSNIEMLQHIYILNTDWSFQILWPLAGGYLLVEKYYSYQTEVHWVILPEKMFCLFLVHCNATYPSRQVFASRDLQSVLSYWLATTNGSSMLERQGGETRFWELPEKPFTLGVFL